MLIRSVLGLVLINALSCPAARGEAHLFSEGQARASLVAGHSLALKAGVASFNPMRFQREC